MTIKELIPLIEAKELTKEADLNKEVLCGYTCDLLSWVMGGFRALSYIWKSGE